MKNNNIASTIVAKRAEKGITQDELAKFIGVSKASISKWEKGHCYPDITFLPQIASFFGISLDELMGYEPQMANDDIRRLYKELLEELAEKPFDDVLTRCRDIIKKYYHCFPLLFQMGMLLANHGAYLNDDEKKLAAITEAKEIFVRVKTLSDDISLKQLAHESEAACEMALGNSTEVIALLKNENRYSVQPSIAVMLSQSYQMLGDMKKAKITLQDHILDSVITLFHETTSYLAICTDDIHHFEEICRRIMEMSEVIKIRELFPVAILPFYLIAAEGYLALESTEKALVMLETYTEIASSDMFSLQARRDNFFTLLDEIQDKRLSEHSFGALEWPRDESSTKQDMVDAVRNHPGFSALRENQGFQRLVKRLEQIL